MKRHSTEISRYGAYYSGREDGGFSEHFVEDARSQKLPREKGKKKKSSGKAKTILLTAAVTVLCFSLTLFAADLLGKTGSIGAYASLFQNRKKLTAYYAVYATHSADMATSYRNASALREEGAAGYVLKEGDEYYVVLNLYENEADAEKVTERKSNYGVLKLEFPPFDVKKRPSLSAAENSKDLYKDAYQTLYQAANDLSAGKYQSEDMLRIVRRYKQKVIVTESAYAEKIRGAEDTASIEYKVILAEILSAFENLENSDKLVADARYYSVMIVRSFALFSKKYFS